MYNIRFALISEFPRTKGFRLHFQYKHIIDRKRLNNYCVFNCYTFNSLRYFITMSENSKLKVSLTITTLFYLSIMLTVMQSHIFLSLQCLLFPGQSPFKGWKKSGAVAPQRASYMARKTSKNSSRNPSQGPSFPFARSSHTRVSG